MSTLSPLPFPLLRRPAPYPYFHPLLLVFHAGSPPMGEVMKIPHPLKKGSGGGRPNYAPPPKVRIPIPNSNLK